jgi:hypothetical protein
MKQSSIHERLSQISTIWADLFQAHCGTPVEVGRAQERLLLRYQTAVHG